MKNQFNDVVEKLSPDELEAFAMQLHERAKELREDEQEKKAKEARLKVEREAFDQRVKSFDESLTKYNELVGEGETQLEDLRESRVKSKVSASEKVYSDADMEQSKGSFWETVIKKPMKDFQFAHLDANIEKFEGSLSRLKGTRDKIIQDRTALIKEHDSQVRARNKLEADQLEEGLQQEACSIVGSIGRGYLRAEIGIERLRTVVESIQTKNWEQKLAKIPGSYPDAYTQLFGGVFAPGRIHQLDFMTLIGYLSSYNLLGDRDTPEYYSRIRGESEHITQNPYIREE